MQLCTTVEQAPRHQRCQRTVLVLDQAVQQTWVEVPCLDRNPVVYQENLAEVPWNPQVLGAEVAAVGRRHHHRRRSPWPQWPPRGLGVSSCRPQGRSQGSQWARLDWCPRTTWRFATPLEQTMIRQSVSQWGMLLWWPILGLYRYGLSQVTSTYLKIGYSQISSMDVRSSYNLSWFDYITRYHGAVSI